MKCYVQEKHLDNKGNVIKTERITGDITDRAWAKKQLDYRTEQLLIAHKNDLINGGISMTDTRTQMLLKKESIIVEIVNIPQYTAREILIALVIKYAGNWDAIMNAVSKREMPEEKYIIEVNNLKCKTVTLLDNDYPQSLKSMVKPPFVLFYYGKLSQLQKSDRNIAILGTRDPSDYGMRKTRELAKDLSYRGYTIVSGLSRGVATIVHNIAIEYPNRKTVAVLPCGIDTCYPAANQNLCDILKKHALVISELPGTVEPSPQHMINRNRIIAGICGTILVTEAKTHSGVSAAVMFGLNVGDNILCVPDHADKDSLCNKLISEGACLVENAQDVVDEISSL